MVVPPRCGVRVGYRQVYAPDRPQGRSGASFCPDFSRGDSAFSFSIAHRILGERSPFISTVLSRWIGERNRKHMEKSRTLRVSIRTKGNVSGMSSVPLLYDEKRPANYPSRRFIKVQGLRIPRQFLPRTRTHLKTHGPHQNGNEVRPVRVLRRAAEAEAGTVDKFLSGVARGEVHEA